VLPVKSAFSGLKKTFKRIAKGLEKAKYVVNCTTEGNSLILLVNKLIRNERKKNYFKRHV
jgi:ribosome recycling factor